MKIKRWWMTAGLLCVSMTFMPFTAMAQASNSLELGNAIVKVLEKYPTQLFSAQGYTLLYGMKPSDSKNKWIKKMQDLKGVVDAEQIIRAEEGLRLADAYPAISSYNTAIHRIERVQSDDVKSAYLSQLKTIVGKKYSEVFAFPRDFSPTTLYIIEQVVDRAESYKSEPFLTEGDEAVRNLPFGETRSKLEKRMIAAHSAVDAAKIEQALKCVDLAAVLEDEGNVAIAIDAIDQVSDRETKSFLEQRLFQFKLRSMSTKDLTPYLRTLKVPNTIKTSSLTVGNALNALLMVEVRPTKEGKKRALDAINKLQESIEKDFLSARINALP